MRSNPEKPKMPKKDLALFALFTFLAITFYLLSLHAINKYGIDSGLIMVFVIIAGASTIGMFAMSARIKQCLMPNGNQENKIEKAVKS